MSTDRKPAIQRPVAHPAADLPSRPAISTGPPAAEAPSRASSAAAAGSSEVERLIEQHNVRIRPSTKQRITKAVDKWRYESGDRSISIASITDAAIDAYLKERGC